MSRLVANLIAALHTAWILAVLVLSGTRYYPAVFAMLALAGIGNLIWGECPFLLMEYHWRNRCKPRVPTSMSRRLFRLIGIKLTEEQTGGLILFLSALAATQSLLRWWFN